MVTSLTSAQLEPSVSEVVRSLHNELHELISQRQQLTRSIRKLHRAVAAFHRFANNDVSVAASRTIRRCKAGEQSLDAGALVSGGMDGSLAAGTRTMAVSPLKRACRIALLETDQPLSETEIYARIVRRGSFAFEEDEVAHAAIARELQAMAKAGEIYLGEDGNGDAAVSRWQRIATAD